jgi:hypothetical protein
MQQEREARRRLAEIQKQVEEKARKDKEERAKALQEQEEDQRAIKASITQKQDALRRTWLNLRAKAESQPTKSVAEGEPASCKHTALIWNRRKGKVDCAFCHRAFAKCFFFQCPDCGTSVCQSCARRSPG